jgi:hypothetical protein
MGGILLALVGRCHRAQEQPHRHHPRAAPRHTMTRDAARLVKLDPIGEEATGTMAVSSARNGARLETEVVE